MTNLCFAHMQKSGGSSAFAYIIESFRADPEWVDTEHYQRIWAEDFVPMHIDSIRSGWVRLLYGHFDPSPILGIFPGRFFTVARDPVDRVISLYNFCATMDDETLAGITGVRKPEFTEITPALWSLSTDMISMINAVRGGLNFADFIRLPPELFLGLESWPDYLAYLPKSGSPAEYADRFDLIGINDDMGWTLSELARVMGWPAPKAVPYVNRTPRACVTRPDLTRADRAIIESRTGFESELYRIARARQAMTACATYMEVALPA